MPEAAPVTMATPRSVMTASPSILNALAFAAGLNALASCDLAQNQAAQKPIAEGLVFPLKAGNKPSEDG
jgi:hypothetical protein